MRRAARVDANHALIVGALMMSGAEVVSLAQLGGGVPDIMVLKPCRADQHGSWHAHRIILMEIKSDKAPPSKRRLTPDQAEFHARWPVHVVENVEQALAIYAEPDKHPTRFDRLQSSDAAMQKLQRISEELNLYDME